MSIADYLSGEGIPEEGICGVVAYLQLQTTEKVWMVEWRPGRRRSKCRNDGSRVQFRNRTGYFLGNDQRERIVCVNEKIHETMRYCWRKRCRQKKEGVNENLKL